jgi:hypothetical protein
MAGIERAFGWSGEMAKSITHAHAQDQCHVTSHVM